MMENPTSPFWGVFQMTIEHTFIGDRAHIVLPLLTTILLVGDATAIAFWGG